MKRKVMRLLILGDESVGKTSLISAMMYDNEGNQVKKLNKVSLSPERCIYSKDIFTELIDTDVESDINQEILLADIILLVYDISEQTTITRIETHWLPIISTIRNSVPVILVGNKLDKKELEMNNKDMEYINVRNIVKSLVKKYRQIQMGFQCSAYYDRNVKKVLNASQRAVLYPLAPLYDLNSKELTPKFKKAIMRIFRILDKDLDGKLTDNQLRNLQEKVFQTDLNGDDIKTIKQIILKELQQFNEDHIKLNGFYALQKKCIEMLKIQICWSILRHFDYNDNLDINQTQQYFIYDQSEGQTLELSPHALNFLQCIYAFSVSSKSQHQTPMQYLFSCSPCIPLQQFKEENISLERFLLAWSMYAFLDYKECYRSLLYVGYEDGLETVFKRVRSKKTYNDLVKLKERKIFTVLVIENNHDKYSNYLELLFKKGVTFPVQNYMQRAGFFFSEQNKLSKVLLMVKVHQKFLEEFVEKNPLKKRIDLVITFENNLQSQEFSHIKIKSSQQIINSAREKFPGHTMFRKFSKKQSQEFFNSPTLPVLNLESLPVQYKQQNWKPLFSQIVKTFEKLQVGYSVEKMEKLKKESEKLNKIWTGVGILGVTVLGCLAMKKNPMSLIRELK